MSNFPGTYGNCSPEQLKALEELKKTIFSVPSIKKRESHYDDVRLLRFLRARDFNVKQAEAMLIANANWRDEEKIDEILTFFPIMSEHSPHIAEFYPRRIHGKSHSGDLVIFERTGLIDVRSLIGVVPHDVLAKYHRFTMETLEQKIQELSKEDGKVRDKGIFYVMDLQGLGWKQFYQPALNIFKERSKINREHYPEILQKTIVINAPYIFNMFWAIIKPVLDQRTLNKVEIVGTDYLPTLEKYIPKSSIPRYLKGECTCEEGKCIPSEGYYRKPTGNEGSSNNLNKEEVVIKAWETFEKEIQIKKAQTIVGWEFYTQDYDIAFAVFLKETDSRKDIVPYSKVNSHLEHNVGSFETKEPGTYVFQWDNSYSNLRSKQLTFVIDIEEPETN